MEPRSNERHRQTGEPASREDGRRSAAEARELSVEAENLPGAVQVRRNTGQPPPSEVRRTQEEHGG